MTSQPASKRSARMLSAKLASLGEHGREAELGARREVVDDLEHRRALVAAAGLAGQHVDGRAARPRPATRRASRRRRTARRPSRRCRSPATASRAAAAACAASPSETTALVIEPTATLDPAHVAPRADLLQRRERDRRPHGVHALGGVGELGADRLQAVEQIAAQLGRAHVDLGRAPWKRSTPVRSSRHRVGGRPAPALVQRDHEPAVELALGRVTATA